MRCVRIDSFGEPREVVRIGEAPDPVPEAGQVRSKMIQSPIHNHDLSTIRGVYGYKPALPFVPGTEALGIVELVGPEVDVVSVGQRVTAAGVRGAWAELFCAKAASIVPVPPSIPDAVACQLLAMPLSAYMLLEDLKLAPGQWLIQNAANGAVGRVIHALAGARGVNVINLVRRQSAARALLGQGVTHVVATEEPPKAGRGGLVVDVMPYLGPRL